MTTCARSIICLILAASMVFALTGHFGLFKAKQYKARKEIKAILKAGVPDSLKVHFYLDEIQANPHLITWMHSKEFRYKGHMYDIIAQKLENDRVVLICIHDVKESGLFADLDRMIERQMNSDSQHQSSRQQWIKLFQSLFYDEIQHISRHEEILPTSAFFLWISFFSTSFNPESPPPEFIC